MGTRDAAALCVADERAAILALAARQASAAHRTGAHDEAARLYAAILEVDPEHFEALLGAGMLAYERGALALARDLIGRAATANPTSAQALVNLGAVHHATGDNVRAEASFRDALKLDPVLPHAWRNLGVLQAGRGELREALGCYRNALAADPGAVELLTAAAGLHAALDEHDVAIGHYRDALSARPDYPPALLGLATTQHTLGDFAAARANFMRARATAPQCMAAWIGIGTVALDSGDFDAAIECFSAVIAREPGHAQARYHRAIAYLCAGRLREGWTEFGWRWASREFDSIPRPFRTARWDGGSLDGRSVLVWREQGLGDEIVFASMLEELAARTARCIVECEPRLHALFSRSFPGIELVAGGHPPHPLTAAAGLDGHAPIGDFARVLRPAIGAFPRKRGYLRADPAAVRDWRVRLERLGPGAKIGICWRSADRRGIRALASTELIHWVPVFAQRGACFINLQYDECRVELADARARFGTEIACFDDLDMRVEIDRTAALIAALDLVISAPTTVSVLAGALGVDTWQLTCGADWHALGEPNSPWQPSVRRFYRTVGERWEDTLAAVAIELDKRGGARYAG